MSWVHWLQPLCCTACCANNPSFCPLLLMIQAVFLIKSDLYQKCHNLWSCTWTKHKHDCKYQKILNIYVDFRSWVLDRDAPVFIGKISVWGWIVGWGDLKPTTGQVVQYDQGGGYARGTLRIHISIPFFNWTTSDRLKGCLRYECKKHCRDTCCTTTIISGLLPCSGWSSGWKSSSL